MELITGVVIKRNPTTGRGQLWPCERMGSLRICRLYMGDELTWGYVAARWDGRYFANLAIEY